MLYNAYYIIIQCVLHNAYYINCELCSDYFKYYESCFKLQSPRPKKRFFIFFFFRISIAPSPSVTMPIAVLLPLSVLLRLLIFPRVTACRALRKPSVVCSSIIFSCFMFDGGGAITSS